MLLIFLGCGFLKAKDPPGVEAHRMGTSMFPENSASALNNALEQGWPAVEMDVLLTADGKVVVNHDPWLESPRCTHADGSAFSERLWIFEHSLADLQADVLCGGAVREEFPEAAVVAEPLLSLQEVIAAVGDSDLQLHLDLKIQEGRTADAATSAAALRAEMADFPNHWWVTGGTEELVTALDNEDPKMEIWLDWPPLPADSDATGRVLAALIELELGTGDPVAAARRSGADGIGVPYQILDLNTVEGAEHAGILVQAWVINGEVALDRYCEWPVHSLISDYPQRAPCL
jgi:glycerophosphoryl diester phosphodiesterase